MVVSRRNGNAAPACEAGFWGSTPPDHPNFAMDRSGMAVRKDYCASVTAAYLQPFKETWQSLVYRTGLENRSGLKTAAGSNPAVSAIFTIKHENSSVSRKDNGFHHQG